MDDKTNASVRKILKLQLMNVVVFGLPSLYLFLIKAGVLRDSLPHGNPIDPLYPFSEALYGAMPWIFLLLFIMMFFMSSLALNAVRGK